MLLFCISLYGVFSLYWFWAFVYKGNISLKRPAHILAAFMAAILWPLGALYLFYDLKR